MASKSQHRRRHRSRPRIFTSPPSNLDMDLGSDLAEVTELAGRPLDTWQHVVLEKASRVNTLAEDGTNPLLAGWTWSASEVGVLTARQNGLTFTAEARELAGLFTFGDRIVHTAATLEAARCSMRNLLDAIKSNPILDKELANVSHTRGSEGILLKNGGAIRYCARRPSSIDASIDADLLVIDDAFNIKDGWAAAAIHGTPFRKPRSKRRQVWYLGTAVAQTRNPNGRIFTAVRNRGLTGKDPHLCWIEYSAPDRRNGNGDLKVDTADPAVIARANPSERLDLDRIADQRHTLLPSDYEAAHLGIGSWPILDEAAA